MHFSWRYCQTKWIVLPLFGRNRRCGKHDIYFCFFFFCGALGKDCFSCSAARLHVKMRNFEITGSGGVNVNISDDSSMLKASRAVPGTITSWGPRLGNLKTYSRAKSEGTTELAKLYIQRLKGLSVKREHFRNSSCPTNGRRSDSPCRNDSCTARFSPPDQRLRTLIQSKYPLTPKYQAIINNLANRSLARVDIVFVTAASANHYNESQGVIRDLHNKVFPFLREHTRLTFKLVYYDLGLSNLQRSLMRKYAKFEVLRFPFEELPSNFKKLGTCIWKPLIIKAHLKHSDFTFWLDASTRLHQGNITTLLQHADATGLGITRNNFMLPQHVAKPMLDYFRLEPCQLSPFYEMQGGFLCFKNEPLIHQAIVDPWVACAFSPDCLCPGNDCQQLYYCRNHNITYSQCHRFDQSALGVILTTLFEWKATNFIIPKFPIEFKRNEQIEYLPTH